MINLEYINNIIHSSYVFIIRLIFLKNALSESEQKPASKVAPKRLNGCTATPNRHRLQVIFSANPVEFTLRDGVCRG